MAKAKAKKTKTKAATELPNMIELAKTAETQAKDAEKSLDFIRGLPCVTNDEYQTALRVCADVKIRHSGIDGTRKRWVDGLNAIAKDINKTLGVPLNFYAEAEAVLKKKMIELNQSRAAEIARLRDEAQEAAKAGDTTKAEELIEQADELEVPKLEGLAIGEAWTGEVTDAEKIPREYLTPDVKALKALTKAKKTDPKIPGWKAYPEGSATVTVSKVER